MPDSSDQRRQRAEISGATLARGRHPKGAAHIDMTEYVPTSHQLMIILVILSHQPRGGSQQSAAAGEGAALD